MLHLNKFLMLLTEQITPTILFSTPFYQYFAIISRCKKPIMQYKTPKTLYSQWHITNCLHNN